MGSLGTWWVKRRLRIALRQLGVNVSTVADTLLRGGFVGIQNDSTACPVARYLQHVLGSGDVSAGLIARAHGVEVRTPYPVMLFIERFDEGAYPLLVKAPLAAVPDPPRHLVSV